MLGPSSFKIDWLDGPRIKLAYIFRAIGRAMDALSLSTPAKKQIGFSGSSFEEAIIATRIVDLANLGSPYLKCHNRCCVEQILLAIQQKNR